MKKIFGSRRSKTPASSVGGGAGGRGGGGEEGSVAGYASPPLSESGLIKPKATYGTPSPSLGVPSTSAFTAPAPYPTPPTTVSAASPAPAPPLPGRVLSPPSAAGGMGMGIYSPPPLPRGVPAPVAVAPQPAMQTLQGGGQQVRPQGQQVVVEADVGGREVEMEGKLSVGIDFGTTFSGVAFGSNRHMGGAVRQILQWPGSYETYRKIPTCIVYYQPTPNEAAIIASWGIEAKAFTARPGYLKIEWFKLFLDPSVLHSGRLADGSDARLPDLPYEKQPIDVVTDFLSCLWRYAKERITEEIGSVADLEAADVILTVPAAWDAAGCGIMREAAIKAQMVQAARGGDRNWRDRLRIITEPEAAAIHASTLSTLLTLRASQTFIICDAGGGTVDTAAYKLIGALSQLEIAEMCARTGANCGSLFLDLRFEGLVKRLLRNHPTHLDFNSITAFRYAFAECEKLIYRGEADDATHFRFNCFNIEGPLFPLHLDIGCRLEYGELVIPGKVLRTEVFDPVVEQVLSIIELQLSKTPQKTVHGLVLVGGFAASEYLNARVYDTFHARIPIIARPRDCDVSTLQGAARYGLGLISGKLAVSSVISPRSYIMKCKLPATEEDRYQRPGFLSTNDAGVEVCENRLSYLVAKGAVLRKGQRLRTRFCKFARGPTDCLFTAILYVSDADKIYRYTDEGEIIELCRWTVDLSPLPAFQYNAAAAQGGAFWVEFDLALVLDSAEVLGVLLTDEGEEVGRATFEFLNNV
ncbi:hypothetical protein JCM8097_004552 [Rhodosporidiobolus ruineniae]